MFFYIIEGSPSLRRSVSSALGLLDSSANTALSMLIVPLSFSGAKVDEYGKKYAYFRNKSNQYSLMVCP